MPGAFDPYHTWLGIPPPEQPPNYYRLLGLAMFEDRPDTIEHAADQRMVHLHALQTGKHAKLADRLMSEVAAARVCLLNSAKKAAYDRQLRDSLRIEAVARQTGICPHLRMVGKRHTVDVLGRVVPCRGTPGQAWGKALRHTRTLKAHSNH